MNSFPVISVSPIAPQWHGEFWYPLLKRNNSVAVSIYAAVPCLSVCLSVCLSLSLYVYVCECFPIEKPKVLWYLKNKVEE